MTTHILVLANSIKVRNRCVAGREVISDGPTYHFGNWIRPIGNRGEGELTLAEVLIGQAFVQPLEFIEVELVQNAANRCQPENWTFNKSVRWKRLISPYLLPNVLDDFLLERPQNLWYQPGEKTDCVRGSFFNNNPPRQSLYLIRPTQFRLKLYTAWGKQKRRAIFTYNQIEYDMSMTDPLIDQKYCQHIPQAGEPSREIMLPCGNDVLLCVSLTNPWSETGNHYKVVATVLEGAR